MALVSITVTADTTAVPGLVPILVAEAQAWMDAQQPKVDYSAMTSQQKVARYVRGLLMAVYVQRTAAASQVTVAATVDAARTQALTDATAGLA